MLPYPAKSPAVARGACEPSQSSSISGAHWQSLDNDNRRSSAWAARWQRDRLAEIRGRALDILLEMVTSVAGQGAREGARAWKRSMRAIEEYWIRHIDPVMTSAQRLNNIFG